MESNANNGLLTKIWGPPTWVSVHSITFGYPVKPTQEQKDNYKQYFKSLGDVLPCRHCRDSYKNFIASGYAEMTDDVFNDRDSLTRWMYRVHECVNRKLDVDYCVSYDEVKDRYESYRAKCDSSKVEKGCINPVHDNPYHMADVKDCPIIPYDVHNKLMKYAKIRGFELDTFIVENADDLESMKNNKKCERWKERNRKTESLIKDMRMNKKKSIETDGDWKGFPTYEEMRLIALYSTMLEQKELTEILKKFPNYKFYVLRS